MRRRSQVSVDRMGGAKSVPEQTGSKAPGDPEADAKPSERAQRFPSRKKTKQAFAAVAAEASVEAVMEPPPSQRVTPIAPLSSRPPKSVRGGRPRELLADPPSEDRGPASKQRDLLADSHGKPAPKSTSRRASSSAMRARTTPVPSSAPPAKPRASRRPTEPFRAIDDPPRHVDLPAVDPGARRHSRRPSAEKQRVTAPLAAATRPASPPAVRPPPPIKSADRVRPPDHDPRAEDPSIVADALEKNLAWLPEEQRPELYAHLMRGEFEAILAMLRGVRSRYPRVVSIPKAIEVVEQALTAKLRSEIGRRSDEVVVHPRAGDELDDSPRSTILRLGRMCGTLGELLDRCPLPALATLRILRDLWEVYSLHIREPVRRATGLRLGDAPPTRPLASFDEPPPITFRADSETKQVRPRPRR